LHWYQGKNGKDHNLVC